MAEAPWRRRLSSNLARARPGERRRRFPSRAVRPPPESLCSRRPEPPLQVARRPGWDQRGAFLSCEDQGSSQDPAITGRQLRSTARLLPLRGCSRPGLSSPCCEGALHSSGGVGGWVLACWSKIASPKCTPARIWTAGADGWMIERELRHSSPGLEERGEGAALADCEPSARSSRLSSACLRFK